ncbi:hypothetical protein [Hanstruepera ponticola]|uniref:hypothetical protein n=1 Tax=Hanstruepera ponticola TaxID=2042995 RepID=UPI00177C0B2A|nr:hypothetical protein [Hanstruepera ponticola]
MKFLKTISLSLLFIVIYSCQRDDSPSELNSNQNNNRDPFIENYGNQITRTFMGRVSYSLNQPLKDVLVKIGDQFTFTDENGIYIIENANVYERFAYITAEKEGFFHSSRTVIPTIGINNVDIRCQSILLIGVTTSGVQETFENTNHGTKITLLGEYINENGSEYTGNVKVYMTRMNYDFENLNFGTHYASNQDNEERLLKLFEVFRIELQGENGERLNIAEGFDAEFEITVNQNNLEDAPSLIPLWYFDETAGYWKEEGQASLVDGKYITTLNKSAIWSCSVPLETASLCINVIDQDGEPLENYTVSVSSNNYDLKNELTNMEGQACQMIPINETLTVNIHSFNYCDNYYTHNESIGSFNLDSEITIVVPSDSEIIKETVSGNFYSCNGNPVTDGYVLLKHGNNNDVYFLREVTNGTFEYNITRCTYYSNFNILGYSNDELESTELNSYNYTTPETVIPDTYSCFQPEEYIIYQVDNHPEIRHDRYIRSGLEGHNIYHLLNLGNGAELTIGSTLDSLEGVHTTNDGSTFFIHFDNNGDSMGGSTEYYFEINITNVAYNIGEFTDGTFSGYYIDGAGINHTVSGEIHAIRDY